MSVTAPPLFSQQAASSIAIDRFEQNFIYLIQHMHSGVGVFHPNSLVSLDMIITAMHSMHSSAQRNHIQRHLHTILILVSLDGWSLGFCIRASSSLCTIPSSKYAGSVLLLGLSFV